MHRQLARLLFENRIMRSEGKAFQTVFEAVASKVFPDFRCIKPQGRKGDQGNDGYIPSTGRFFQVFAPENPKASVAIAVQKSKADFDKILKDWASYCAPREYIFVYNDKYLGCFPEIEQALLDIKQAHKLNDSRPYLTRNLTNDFLELELHHIEDIIGPLPDPACLEGLDHASLRECLETILNSDAPDVCASLLNAPDFDAKIKFNGLSAQIGSSLSYASYHRSSIDDYFSRGDVYLKACVRDQLNRMYKEERARSQAAPHTANAADRTYASLLYRIAPGRKKAAVDAANVLISFFFESCDVYEDPSGHS